MLIHSPTTEPDCYRAIPTIIDDDSGIVQVDDNNNNSNNSKNQENIEAITSDSDLSLVNCYDVENAKIYRKTSGGEHELRITVNTEGLLYKPINDEIDGIEMVSENPTVSIDIDQTELPPNIEIHVNTEKTPEIIPRQFKAPIAQKRSKKSDNTLIRKIYSDPVVRSFVLVNREQIPIDDDGVDEFRPEIMVSTPKIQQQKHNISIELSPINVEEFEKFDKSPTLDNFSLELSDNEAVLQRQNSIIQDPEITQLKERRLVANRLGEFSKSFPNLTNLHKRYVQEKCEETQCNGWKSNDLQQQSFVSVKDLKKKFESNEAIDKNKPVHSLTARSISKPIREKLRIEDNNRNYDKIVGSVEFRNVEEEEVIDANTNQ